MEKKFFFSLFIFCFLLYYIKNKWKFNHQLKEVEDYLHFKTKIKNKLF